MSNQSSCLLSKPYALEAGSGSQGTWLFKLCGARTRRLRSWQRGALSQPCIAWPFGASGASAYCLLCHSVESRHPVPPHATHVLPLGNVPLCLVARNFSALEVRAVKSDAQTTSTTFPNLICPCFYFLQSTYTIVHHLFAGLLVYCLCLS